MERSGIVFAEEGVEIQSFAVPLISRKKGLMLALPVGLIKSGLLSPGGPIDEDAVVGPSHIFEVDLILEDELTGAPYSADTKVEVLVADFSNDVLPLLRDYDPVSDSTEGIRGYDERHPTGIPTAPDLLTTVMTWAESDMASRAHFYSAREEPGPKTSGVAKRPPAKRMTTAALAEQIATLSAQVSLLTAQQRQGLELEEKPMVVKSPPPRTPAIRAPEPNVLVAQGMAPKMPAVSAGLQSPEIHRSSRVLQLAGPPPKTRASPGTSGLALLPPDEPYDPVKAPLETPEQILASQAVALNALVSHLIQGGDSLSMDFHAGGAASSSTRGTVKRERLQQELASRQSGSQIPKEAQGGRGGTTMKTSPLRKEFTSSSKTSWSACDLQRDLLGWPPDPTCAEPTCDGGQSSRPLSSPFSPGVGAGSFTSEHPSRPKDGLSGSKHGIIRQLSYPLWCMKLTTLVLRSRTAFASFVASSIRISRGPLPRTSTSPALFPVPPPVDGCFDRMPAGISSYRRRATGLARAVHIICMALNFWHSGGNFQYLDSLWRAPNPLHRALYKRIRAFVKSDGLTAGFDSLHVGRKNPELFARLNELTSMLTMLGCSASPYSRVFTGYDVAKDNSQFPELEPYRDLDPSRLFLFGRGLGT